MMLVVAVASRRITVVSEIFWKVEPFTLWWLGRDGVEAGTVIAKKLCNEVAPKLTSKLASRRWNGNLPGVTPRQH